MTRKTFILFILIYCSTVTAQGLRIDRSIIIPTANGAKGSAMGQAFTAIADDGSALAWNPAGLAQLQVNMAALSGKLGFGAIDVQQSESSTTDYSAEQGTVPSMNYIGFVIPIPAELKNLNPVSSFAIRNLSDFADEISWSESSGNDNTDYLYKREGGLFSLSGGLGIRPFNSLYIGGSLNFLSGKQDSSLLTIAKRADEDTPDSLRRQTKNVYSGFHLEIGLIWKPFKALSAGGRIRLPHILHLNNIKYQINEEDEQSIDTEIAVKMPLSMTFGLALNPVKEFTLALDYAIKPWSDIEVNYEIPNPDKPFKDAHSFHVGAEYRARIHSITFPWRVGFFSQPEQVGSFNIAGAADQTISQNFTAGFGIYGKNVLLDFSLIYKSLEYDSISLPFDQSQYQIKRDIFNLVAQLQVFI
ncbi:hypothetical protein GF407_10230 [candidate division KSB1 bacterium]|nr:hypothetical protein [candidate division KSB1 bacterium]